MECVTLFLSAFSEASPVIGRTYRALAAAFPLLIAAMFLQASDSPARVTAEEALAKLKAGNERFVAHRMNHPDQSAQRMHDLEEAQHPYAVVLGCSDSRVPPEVIFDQGLGDLFVIRVAGVVPDEEVVGSIEYAVEHLHVPLVVVLGHEKCGAVTAAATVHLEKDHMGSFLNFLKPHVDAARDLEGDLIHNAVCLSVDRISEQLRGSQPVLEPAVLEGKVKIVGARYDLHTGKVIWHEAPKPSVPGIPSETE
jgi:carbonic anhydrase